MTLVLPRPLMLSLLLLCLSLTGCVKVQGQFTCTLGARDETTCLNTQDDDGASCVWCALASFGVCLNEAAAEAAEQSLPGIQCDRSNPSTDDAATPAPKPSSPKPPTSPKPPSPKPPPPKTDDNIKPNDDKIPDNFWNCLNHGDVTSCKADVGKCTWCKSQAGYGLCLTGPAAQQAKKSHFYQCESTSASASSYSEQEDVVRVVQAPEDNTEDPMDASCIMAYLQDPTQEGCTSAIDQDGDACEWCSLAGITNVCLTPDQAQQGAALGITCDGGGGSSRHSNESPLTDVTTTTMVHDPLDPSCILAYVQTPTQDGCTSAVDQDGTPCEYCNFQGFNVCLTSEQAQMGQQAGITCDTATSSATTSIKKAGSDASTTAVVMVDLPTDHSCTNQLALLHDALPYECRTLFDAHGEACRLCSISHSTYTICLSSEQAALAVQYGSGLIHCDTSNAVDAALTTTKKNTPANPQRDDIMDPSCVEAFVEGGETSTACTSAKDEGGDRCQYCTRDGYRHVCVTASQADLLASMMGFWCDNHHNSKEATRTVLKTKAQQQPQEPKQHPQHHNIQLPDDFLQCLEHYQADDCAPHGCTWCKTQVGMAFCTSNAVADAMKECTFFDCQYTHDNAKEESDVTNKEIENVASTTTPFDPTCMTAGFQNPQNAQEVCGTTSDQSGTPCVWCHSADDMVGLCFSSDQAAKASAILQCDSGILVETTSEMVASE